MSVIAESILIQQRSDAATGVGVETARMDDTGVKATSPAKLRQDGNIVHDKESYPLEILAATTTKAVFGPVREGVWVLDSVSTYFQTGSTSGTMTLTVETGTTAPGSGTAQLTAPMSLAAAAQQTIVNGTLITSPTEMPPGARLSLVIAGTMTNLANCIATYTLRRIR